MQTIASSHLLGRSRERGGHGLDELAPAVRFSAKPALSGGGQPIETRGPVVVRCPPLRVEQFLALEPGERLVESALIDGERPAGNLRNSQQDAIAMGRSQRHGFENEQVESAWEQLGHVSPETLRRGERLPDYKRTFRRTSVASSGA